MLKKKGMKKSKLLGLDTIFWLVCILTLFTFYFHLHQDFHKDPEGEQQQQKKKGAKFKPIKVLKRLSHKAEPGKSPRKEKTP